MSEIACDTNSNLFRILIPMDVSLEEEAQFMNDGQDNGLEDCPLLNPKEAYLVMHRFLEFQWKLRGSPINEFSEFLSSSAVDTFRKNKVADPAIWDDWMKFVDEVHGGKSEISEEFLR